MNLILNKVVMEGFQGFKNRVEIDLQNGKNNIIADNGRGKTTIGEAITFAFTGKNMNGATRVQFINLNVNSAVVEVFFTLDGQQNHLHRMLEDSKTTIKLNGRVINQNELNSVINSEMFLTSFNPMLFLSLDPTPARKMIFNILPKISDEMVFNIMDPVSQEFLRNESFNSEQPKQYIDYYTKMKKEYEADLKHQEGYMDRVRQVVQVSPLPNMNRKDEIEQRLQYLMNVQAQIMAKEEYQMENKESIQKQLNEAMQELNKWNQLSPETNSGLNEALTQKNLLEHQMKQIQEQVYNSYNENLKVQNLLSTRQNLLNDYERKNKQVKETEVMLNRKQEESRNDVKCPTCNQDLQEQAKTTFLNQCNHEINNLMQTLNQLNNEKQSIITKGKEIAQEVETLQLSLQENSKKFELDKNNKMKELQVSEQSLLQKIAQLNDVTAKMKEEQQQRIQETQNKINHYQTAAMNLDGFNQQKQQMLQQELMPVQTEMQSLQEELKMINEQITRHNMTKEQELNRQKELTSLLKAESELKEEIQNAHLRIHYMKEFTAARVQVLHNAMNNHLERVQINLQEIVHSTGEIKDTFKVYFDGKPLQVCSLSEQMKAGFEISNMINVLQDSMLPIFIDNSESITVIEPKHEQYILAKVQQGAELSINNKIAEGVV